MGEQYHHSLSGGDEAGKLRKHLELLRDEHVKVQNDLASLQRKFDIVSASSQVHGPGQFNAGGDTNDSFVHRLVRTVTELFEKDLYSDITIHLDGHQLRAHRFVLAARSSNWGVADLAAVDRLEFDGIPYNIGYTMLKWVYTDQVDSKLGDTFMLDLMKSAKKFQLSSLFTRCEHFLVSRLDVKNCISIYQSAEEIEAVNLRDSCSQLISTHWDDFDSEDFASMPAQLLYKMLRTKVKFPLHEAIRLRREDVVFLFLIEFDSELHNKLNEYDSKGELPLNLALSTGQEAIARSLVSHRANIDAVDSFGRTLFFSATERGDGFACKFLLENDANPNCIQNDSGKTPLHVLCSLSEESISHDTRIPNSDGGGGGRIKTVVSMGKIVEMLFMKNPNVNAIDKNGSTPLHCAVTSENAVLFHRLMSSSNLSFNPTDNEGKTPLSKALDAKTQKSLDMATQLVVKGADVNIVNQQTGDTLLHENVGNSNLEAVNFLLKQKATVDVQNLNGETPLHSACEVGSLEISRSLLDAGADSNLQTKPTRNPGSQTPLHLSIANGYADIVNEILDYKKNSERKVPDLTISDTTGETPLGFALWSGLYNVAEKLISGGADVNVENGAGWALLSRAISEGNEDASLFLIKHGANAGAKTPEGDFPLQLAVGGKLSSVVRALCRAGADMNVKDSEGLPPLWTALINDDEDTASALVEHGCETDCWGPGPSGSQQTLLHRAIDENNENCACFLIRSFCDVNAARRPGPNGEGEEEARDKQTPLHMCATWGLENTVSALLEHNANVNTQDVEGKSPVHVAVVNHQTNILKMLLRSTDVSLTVKDKRGLTPFATAMQVKNNQAARAILEREPRVASQVDGKGYSFLHTAVKQGEFESVLFLLSVNVDINMTTQDSTKLTPLHLSAEAGNEMIMRNLLLAGAHINALTNRNQTALHIAAENDHAKLCSILLENGIDFDACDTVLNTALHVAVHKGNVGSVRVLLTESHINAEAVNMKGQTALHLLGVFGKDNAGTIFEIFMDTMPNYPVDKPDVEGNTMLLLAYMNGNAQLCRAAVRNGACLGVTDRNGTSIFNYQTPTKQLLFRLLDQLAAEPKWADGENCSECAGKFSITVRKHHCRHCGRLLCAKCSEKTMPILKYDLQKPVRVCDVCYDVLTLGSGQ